jgi:hypothetical protein
MAEPKHPVHPVVKKLEAAGGAEGAVKLLGYFGGAAGERTVKIYASLEDLSVHYEVGEADILHVEAADASELPHGGSAIWLKGDAQVQRCVTRRESTQARFLAGRIAARMAGGPAVTYRTLARAALEPETAACEGYSYWPCSVVWGACLESSFPCVPTEAWLCQVGSVDSCMPTCDGYTCNYQCHSVDPRDCPPTPQWRTCGLMCGILTRRCEVASVFCRR